MWGRGKWSGRKICKMLEEMVTKLNGKLDNKHKHS